MDKKYINYSAEDFIQDIYFINWVNRGLGQKEWETFISENPTLLKEIRGAREIVIAFRYSMKDSSEANEYEIYKKIESYYTEHHHSNRSVRFRKIMQYAAIFIFVLSIGAAIPIFYLSQNTNKYTEITKVPTKCNEAKLILSGGEEILLNKKLTDLQFSASGRQIKIDRDSIINYNRETDLKALAQVVIPYGKRSTILLSDGTKVWLNAGSELTFPQKFSGKNRKVYLKGEAYFDVFKNKEIPFIVSTNDMNVTVHGTEFNMRNDVSDNELEVVLVEGSVSLKENGAMNILNKEIILAPNQKAVFNKAENKTIVESNVNVAYYISWKEGLLKFDRESILNVFNKLSRFYNVRFATESGVELNRKISGKLDLKESLEDVMRVVSDAAPIIFRIDQDQVFINNKKSFLPMQ